MHAFAFVDKFVYDDDDDDDIVLNEVETNQSFKKGHCSRVLIYQRKHEKKNIFVDIKTTNDILLSYDRMITVIAKIVISFLHTK